MAMFLKMTVLFLVCSILICYGKDQSFDQSLEQMVTEEYWDALEKQDNEDAGEDVGNETQVNGNTKVYSTLPRKR